MVGAFRCGTEPLYHTAQTMKWENCVCQFQLRQQNIWMKAFLGCQTFSVKTWEHLVSVVARDVRFIS